MCSMGYNMIDSSSSTVLGVLHIYAGSILFRRIFLCSPLSSSPPHRYVAFPRSLVHAKFLSRLPADCGAWGRSATNGKMSSFLEDTSAPDANHRRRLLHTLRIAVDELGQEHPPRPGGLAFPRWWCPTPLRLRSATSRKICLRWSTIVSREKSPDRGGGGGAYRKGLLHFNITE